MRTTLFISCTIESVDENTQDIIHHLKRNNGIANFFFN